jgi:hypothetical protein
MRKGLILEATTVLGQSFPTAVWCLLCLLFRALNYFGVFSCCKVKHCLIWIRPTKHWPALIRHPNVRGFHRHPGRVHNEHGVEFGILLYSIAHVVLRLSVCTIIRCKEHLILLLFGALPLSHRFRSALNQDLVSLLAFLLLYVLLEMLLNLIEVVIVGEWVDRSVLIGYILFIVFG